MKFHNIVYWWLLRSYCRLRYLVGSIFARLLFFGSFKFAQVSVVVVSIIVIKFRPGCSVVDVVLKIDLLFLLLFDEDRELFQNLRVCPRRCTRKSATSAGVRKFFGTMLPNRWLNLAKPAPLVVAEDARVDNGSDDLSTET